MTTRDTQRIREVKAAEKARRRAEADVRNEEYRALTAEQKLARLDAKLGAGVGAVKERSSLFAAAANAAAANAAAANAASSVLVTSEAPVVTAKKQKLGK
jgi:Flp pilus assembly protein TadB